MAFRQFDRGRNENEKFGSDGKGNVGVRVVSSSDDLAVSSSKEAIERNEILKAIRDELRINNFHLSLINDEVVTIEDLDSDV